jgi:hypothetical protein
MNKLRCDICGKEVPIGRMMVGGPFHALCENCDEIANKAIHAYLKMIVRNPLGWFAQTIVKIDEEREKASK